MEWSGRLAMLHACRLCHDCGVQVACHSNDIFHLFFRECGLVALGYNTYLSPHFLRGYPA